MITNTISDSSQFPSFSMVLETENLATASLEGLSLALRALLTQDISPTQAEEVWLIESGQVPPDLLESLQERFPWLQIYSTAHISHYYEAKMLGAKLCTGEVIVYCDSDCIYEPQWLRMLLTPFRENPELQVLAGETTTNGKGAYGVAMALTYIFPPYSQGQNLRITGQYFLNNVAFRRQFLLDHPIPLDVPLYRGHCVIHAQRFQAEGYSIWQQPLSRAKHAPPAGLSHFFWRFLLIGHDYYWQNQLLQGEKIVNRSEDPAFAWQGKLKAFQERFRAIFWAKPRNFLYLPLALPVAIAAIALIVVGYLITRLRPKILLSTFAQMD